jgi:SAM-dependent methyltransferase
VTSERRYALKLDDAEVERYRGMAEAAREAEADVWELAGIVPGVLVADVGCGPGAMLPALAGAVGPDGRVAAVDADPEAVAAAAALVAAAGLGTVSVREGRADQTGLEAGSLDVVMVRHVLAHNGGAEDAIVAHLAALLRPGGCLYLVDADGTAIRALPEIPELVDLQNHYLAFRAARATTTRPASGSANGWSGPALSWSSSGAGTRSCRRRLACARPPGRPGRRWSRPAWRPPRTSGAGTGPSRRQRPR